MTSIVHDRSSQGGHVTTSVDRLSLLRRYGNVAVQGMVTPLWVSAFNEIWGIA